MIKLFLLILVTIGLSTCSQADSIEKLRAESYKLKEAYPNNYGNIVTNLNSGSMMKMNTIHKNELEKMEKEFPKDIYQKFKGIMYSQSTQLNVFHFISDQLSTSVKEYLGTAIKEGEYIRYNYIDTFATGTIVAQYDRIEQKHCYTWWLFWTKCDKFYSVKIRGNTATEIADIQRTLRAHAYQNLMKKIDTLSLDVQFVLDKDNRINSYSKAYDLQLDTSTGQIAIKSPGKSISLKNYSNAAINPADGPFSLQLKTSGNMQLQGKEKKVWQTGTGFKGVEPYKIVLTEDPAVLIVDSNWKPLWDSQGLYDNYDVALIEHNMLYSKNDKYYVLLQKDGNLVLYSNNKNQQDVPPIWCSGITMENEGPYSLIVNKKGIMQILGKNNQVVWTAENLKQGIPPFTISVTNNGAFILKDRRNVTIWTSTSAISKNLY